MSYNLVLLGSNVIIAAALILATLGLTPGIAWRALAGTGIMVICHALAVVFVVLYFLMDQKKFFIPVNYSAPFAAFITWAHTLVNAQFELCHVSFRGLGCGLH